MIYFGGCLCGKLQYESSSAPVEKGYCHCSICRKSTSAPVVAFASFPVMNFKYSSGQPGIYYSSESGQREFCSNCGTPIAHRRRFNPTTVDVNSGTLDDVESVVPDFHIYLDNQVSWLNIHDNLPRHKEGAE